ncbi:MAG: 2-hydroxyglutaryl-CoA dehydratase [Deltaproteobacteria bacterium]|nr:2-hydroxyglutaryl-CoA dehydratase [Deltaproteobacteria bacterium]
MICAGIDIGAVNTAVVVLEGDRITGSRVLDSFEESLDPRQVTDLLLEKSGIRWEDVRAFVATGRGRNGCTFAQKTGSDVACQARGAYWLFPSARTIMNLGAEASRVVSLDQHGRVISFATNDKCAAGSGLFLDSMAHLMNLDVSEIGEFALKAGSAIEVSSRCAVFAESEVISHIHKGESRENILAGLHTAVADRIFELSCKLTFMPDLVLTGGVAKNIAVVKLIEKKLGTPALVPSNPGIVGALGAALIARSIRE